MDPVFVHGALLFTVLLISLVVHEASHAITALWGGDPSAYLGGQVSLNPIPHIRREPFGTVLLPIAALVMSGATMCFGYAHAPFDPLWAERHPRKAALMAAAGPVSNFLMAGLAIVVLKILVSQGLVEMHRASSLWGRFLPADGATSGGLFAVCQFLAAFLLMNLLLGILNLIPLPPLDGAGIVGGLFPRSMGRVYEFMQTQPIFMIIGLVAIWYGLGDVIWTAFHIAEGWIR